jgi:hypothetical protein
VWSPWCGPETPFALARAAPTIPVILTEGKNPTRSAYRRSFSSR